MSTIDRAIVIAVEAHKGVVDKAGAPYILHPLRVMLHMNTVQEMIVAVLHDVVEDCEDWNFEKLLTQGFNEEIISALDSVTIRQGETYDEFINRASTNTIGKKVKIADLEDNMDISRISNVSEKDRNRLNQYIKALKKLQK